MTTEIPKRPEILDSLNYVAHVEAVARVAVEALRAIRVFVQDCIVTGHDRGSLGNLYAARDEIDHALTAIEASGWQP